MASSILLIYYNASLHDKRFAGRFFWYIKCARQSHSVQHGVKCCVINVNFTRASRNARSCNLIYSFETTNRVRGCSFGCGFLKKCSDSSPYIHGGYSNMEMLRWNVGASTMNNYIYAQWGAVHKDVCINSLMN